MNNKVVKIFGGPGTGKTTFLIDVIKNSGIPSSKIAYVTFKKEAAQEMVDKIKDVDMSNSTEFFRTLHSMNFKLLGLKKENVFDVSDKILVEKFNKDTGFRISNSYDKAKNENQPFLHDEFYDAFMKSRSYLKEDEYVPRFLTSFGEDYLRFVKAYRGWLQDNNLIDFTGFFERGIEEGVCPDVEMLLVDEWQDLTPLQIKQIEDWIKQIPISYHAGDDDQCIYEWAGAKSDSFLNLPCTEEVILGTTYRLPNNILNFSQKLIKKNKIRKDKDIKSVKPDGKIEQGSLRNIAQYLNEYEKSSSTYILIRNNFIAHKLKQVLQEVGLPTQINKHDIGMFLVFNNLFKTKIATRQMIESLVYESLFPANRYFQRGAKKKLKDYLSVMAWDEEMDLNHLLSNYMTEAFYMDISRNDFSNIDITPHYFRYIQHIVNTYGVDFKPIQIMNIHQSKGLEADNIILIPDVSKKVLSSEMSDTHIESERRVWYTAITRSKKNLFLAFPIYGYHYSRLINSLFQTLE